MSIDYTQLATEIQTDPLGLGYAAHVAGGNDSAIADLLNLFRVGIFVDRNFITGNEFLDAVVQADYNALAANSDARPWVKTLATMGQIDVKSANVRAIVAAIFPAGSETRANLIALQTRQGSRAEQLFGIGVSVSFLDVARALGRG